MPTPPSLHLLLHDRHGGHFGALLLAPGDEPVKGDCIFQIQPLTEAQEALPEARWLAKRSFETRGEHRYKFAEDGILTVNLGEFQVRFGPDDDSTLRSLPPAPYVRVDWKQD
jgi:hypothetical protein